MIDESHAITFGITLWTGLVPKPKVDSQHLSTDLSKAYFKTDGLEVNSLRTRERLEWEQKGLNRVDCLRIHFNLPNVGVRYESPNGLIDFDSKNCHLFFGPDKSLFHILRIATNTEPTEWPLGSNEENG